MKEEEEDNAGDAIDIVGGFVREALGGVRGVGELRGRAVLGSVVAMRGVLGMDGQRPNCSNGKGRWLAAGAMMSLECDAGDIGINRLC